MDSDKKPHLPGRCREFEQWLLLHGWFAAGEYHAAHRKERFFHHRNDLADIAQVISGQDC
jgi:hypothetical protein